MASNAVVQSADVEPDRSLAGVSVRTVLAIGSAGEPGLVRRLVEVSAGAGFDGVVGGGGELWFVIEGTGRLDCGDQAGLELGPDLGLLVPPGLEYRLVSDPGAGMRLDVVALPESAAMSASRSLLVRELAGCAVETTGDRRFRVLFGPGADCSVATQFVGEIPPGRAPAHSHPYDETVMVLEGGGTVHLGGEAFPLAPGTCTHLPPGRPHCLENTGTSMLRVLGVFHPADSPAAKLSS
ncbi:MAG TPA: cupin domain-containing protein [Streptosporangiaceae bacterium]|nr:cupin domain-containing protein [Streptosporangiaceae bacterium]